MNLANKVSIARIMLIPFFIGAIIYGCTKVALIFFVAAVVSDAFDGYIARTRNQKTKLGTFLDPLADKLLLISAFICLAVSKNIPDALRFPAYVPIAVISRDVLIALGSLVIYKVAGHFDIRPSISGKITTVFQMVTIVSVLLGAPFAAVVWNITVALTVVSGIDYLIVGSRLLSAGAALPKKA